KAEALVRADQLVGTERVEAVSLEPGIWRLTAHGLGGHASAPAGTVNAVGVLVEYPLEKQVCHGDEAAFLRLLSRLHGAPDGSALGVAADDGLFQPLTIIGSVVGIEDGRLFQVFDCRYPGTMSGDRLASLLKQQAGDLAEIAIDADKPPFYMPLDNPAVQVCIGAYNDITGEQARPYTIGGGTYAREFPNAVSFGPEHPERPQPAFAGPIHGVDEAASKAFFLEALQVYILALLRLEELDFS
ncbi:MAG: M20/M25/M40 family metallo-hydrolase, partial [Oscillospiraceae bacterium]|nr:M20/M25/M40 family metallo-hydrolase [Oscillospiraceae bacterium]